MTDLGIIIVSWNVRQLLAACLESVVSDAERTPDSGPLTAEVIVVDNASHDGSADMVAAEFPHARLFRQGPALVINQGVEVRYGFRVSHQK